MCSCWISHLTISSTEAITRNNINNFMIHKKKNVSLFFLFTVKSLFGLWVLMQSTFNFYRVDMQLSYEKARKWIWFDTGAFQISLWFFRSFWGTSRWRIFFPIWLFKAFSRWKSQNFPNKGQSTQDPPFISKFSQ